MNNRDITDEQLVAYVDGTLDEALKSEVEAMIESSDEMKEKVEAIRKTNLILSQVSKELQNEPLPQDIQNLIESHKQQEQKEADLDTVSNEDSKKAMPQWIQSTIAAILPIRMPQFMMLAACLLLGLYVGVGINYQQEPIVLISDENLIRAKVETAKEEPLVMFSRIEPQENLIRGANTEIGMYEVMTLRGDNSYVDEIARVSALRSDIKLIEKEIREEIDRFVGTSTKTAFNRNLSYDLSSYSLVENVDRKVKELNELEIVEALEEAEELELETAITLERIENLQKRKGLIEEQLKELEESNDRRSEIQDIIVESTLESSIENILERILIERRVESVITENNLQYQVKLLKSFEAVDGTYCDIGQIIDPEDGTLFFLGCPKNNGSFSIEFTDKRPQL